MAINLFDKEMVLNIFKALPKLITDRDIYNIFMTKPFKVKDNSLIYNIFKYITKNAEAGLEDYDDAIGMYVAIKIADKLSIARFDNDVVSKRVEKLLNYHDFDLNINPSVENKIKCQLKE